MADATQVAVVQLAATLQWQEAQMLSPVSFNGRTTNIKTFSELSTADKQAWVAIAYAVLAECIS